MAWLANQMPLFVMVRKYPNNPLRGMAREGLQESFICKALYCVSSYYSSHLIWSPEDGVRDMKGFKHSMPHGQVRREIT